MMGICSSPLSFDDMACLTAVKAREIMSRYSTTTDVALPSANHQSMNCCGCIRYVTVTEDIPAPSDGKQKQASGNKKNSSDESKPKANKVPVGFGMFSL
jgi:hypothetical protein